MGTIGEQIASSAGEAEWPAWFDLPAEQLAAHSPLPLRVLADGDALHADFAEAIAAEIEAGRRDGKPVRLILPVGPVRHYPLLAALCNRRRIGWQGCRLFLMDEYCDWQGQRIATDHPLSFCGFFLRELVAKLDADLRPSLAQIHLPNPRRLDEVAEAIDAVGGIDTCYGGVGIHGHVAFNEPPLAPWLRVSADAYRACPPRLLALNPETVVMNGARGAGGYLPALPPMAVTLGMREIFGARRIRLYCQGGAWQRAILRIALFGRPDAQAAAAQAAAAQAADAQAEVWAAGEDVRYPVTLLRRHADIAFAADLDTAQPVALHIQV